MANRTMALSEPIVAIRLQASQRRLQAVLVLDLRRFGCDKKRLHLEVVSRESMAYILKRREVHKSAFSLR